MQGLTPEGRQWAHAHFTESLVARVALDGGGWPEEFRATAIRACNAEAAKVADALAEEPLTVSAV